VGGRSQYHAHIATATLGKTLSDYKWVFEADYGLYVLDLAEGLWGMSKKLYQEVKRWPQTIYRIAEAMDAMRSPAELVKAIKSARISIANQHSSSVSLAAQVSNTTRFIVNLEAARARYKIINDLTQRADAIYASAWRNAVFSSSSAYFLREQTEAPVRRESLSRTISEGPGAHV
jgi:hypothetical protein